MQTKKTSKTILGLDLGTTSIGWALVREGANADIIKAGVRVVPLSTDEIQNFDKGKSITTNADRTLKRSMRRNLQRYKLRRANLIEALTSNNIITDAALFESGKNSTFETISIRARAVTQRIELSEFARVLLMLNKKRGYKSSRKVKSDEEGQLIDGMATAKKIYDEGLTPGQIVYEIAQSGKMHFPDFYQSDLRNEFVSIWTFQQKFHKELNAALKDEILGRPVNQTKAIFKKQLGIEGTELKGKEGKSEKIRLRAEAILSQLSLNELYEVFCDINRAINNSSGYLGAISDRSKLLYFNKQTVGQYLYGQVLKDSHTRLKSQVFYRQDYLDEFERIWEKQAEFHKELTTELKREIRDIIIFYQRPLKSQKGLLATCEFENKEIEITIDGKPKKKTIGPKVCPKSSPLFQEFKIWSQLNNVELKDENGKKLRCLELEEIEILFEKANWSEKITSAEALKMLKLKGVKLNYDNLEGNKTNSAFKDAFQKILDVSGHEGLRLNGLSTDQMLSKLKAVLINLGISSSILDFNTDVPDSEFCEQEFYQLWHLLYSYEGDSSNTGIEKLKSHLHSKFGIPKEYASILANISFSDNYSSLSSKAIKKILPFLKQGLKYDRACEMAGYNHAHSQTREDLDNKVLKDSIEILPKNCLRNPVVEKILNQMINVVNEVIKTYGRPDEIRLEMARELKKSAKERQSLTKAINASSIKHISYRKILKEEFGILNPSRNDLIRYKLYEELKPTGYHTLYSKTYISKDRLFTPEFDIEHIIPKARRFDDSFANKTLELRSVNEKKGNATAIDFVEGEFGEAHAEAYKTAVKSLLYAGENSISKTKYKNLLTPQTEIKDDFLERDLRNTQYIAKKAKDILNQVVRSVYTTTGEITNRLRDDWQLVDILKELNWEKYNTLGLTHEVENRHGQKLMKIRDWTKRNDHRHHAMDAITVAFTKPSYVQYLNNLNAKHNSDNKHASSILGIEAKETYFDSKSKRRFNPPLPLEKFRARAKEELESILISFKAKNKVTTKNKNITKKKNGINIQVVETPRGQLHLETIYGSSLVYKTKQEKINASFDLAKIEMVSKKKQRELLKERLSEFGNDPKKAFAGKNSLAKNPIYLDSSKTESLPETVTLVWQEKQYTIRKPISPDLKVDKVIDSKIREILSDRIKQFGDAKAAFSNLSDNPIYLNKEKGIQIKSVTISGISKAESLHSAKDHFGRIIEWRNEPVDSDYVNTGNNHHVAIYQDEKGNLQEEIVSFMEAVTRKNQGLPIINRKHEKEWKFMFTMKQNECFIFPNDKTGFDPHAIDLLNPDNYKLISPNLFRVQKISSKNYFFRHHLETNVEEPVEMKNISYKPQLGLNGIKNIIKVRINHLGQIVQVGEY